MDAIIKPFPGKTRLDPAKPVIMVATKPDLDLFVKTIGFKKNDFSHLYMSRIYSNEHITVVGPFMGASYAVMLLENIICRGGESVIFFGWAGSIKDDTSIGDIVIPKGAFCHEGTSKNYLESDYSKPDPTLTSSLKEGFSKKEIGFKERKIWTTDGIFRETPGKVDKFSSKGASAVEMELSALLTVGKYRDKKVSSVLLISDEIFTGNYKTGHKSPVFKQNREKIISILSAGLIV